MGSASVSYRNRTSTPSDDARVYDAGSGARSDHAQKGLLGLVTTLLRFLLSYPGQPSGCLPYSSTAQLPQRSEARQYLDLLGISRWGNFSSPETSYKTLDDPALPLRSSFLSYRMGESDEGSLRLF